MWVKFLSLFLHTGKCVNSGGHRVFSDARRLRWHIFTGKEKVSYREEMCACLLSSLPLNKHDKRENFQQKRSRICHLKWQLGLHTSKGTLRSCVLFRFCSYAELKWSVSIYCFCLVVSAKGKETNVTPSHRGSGLTRWSPEQAEDRDELMSSRVWGQKAARKLLHWLKITWSGFYLAVSCLDGLDENLLSCRGFNVRFGLNHCL